MTEAGPPRFAVAHFSTRWQRAGWVLLDLVLACALVVVAVQVRTAWQDAVLVADWPWFVHSSNAMAMGEPPPFLQLLYSSVPCACFAGLIRLTQDPDRLLWAWAALGALSAPLSYLAVRRIAGPAAGLAAGLILALSSGDAAVVEGIKSPYIISTFTALAALGLVGATQRRPWGSPLLVLGAAMAVGFHLGLWPIVLPVCLLAAVHLLRLRRRQAITSGLVCLLAGGAVLGWVLVADLEHLLGDLAFYQGAFPSQAPAAAGARALWSLDLLLQQQRALAGWSGLQSGLDGMFMQGLASTATSLLLVAALVWAGLGALAVRLVLALRRRRAGTPPTADQRWQLTAGYAGLQAWLLVLCGSFIYLKNGWQFDYLEFHHFVSLPPLLLVAVAGLGVALLPARWRWLPSIVPTAAALAWLALAWGGPLHPLPRPEAPPPRDAHTVRSARTANTMSALVRTDAQGRGVQPGLVLWGPFGDSLEPWLFAALVNAQARLAWDDRSLPHGCYLATTPTLARRIEVGERLLEQPDGLVLIALTSCDDLRALDHRLCHTAGSRRWRGDNGGPPMAETAFLEDYLSCSLSHSEAQDLPVEGS
jgi:hypothetical protein